MNLNMPWSRREDVIQYFSLIPVLHCHDKLDLTLGNFLLGSRLLSRRKGATAELKDRRH